MKDWYVTHGSDENGHDDYAVQLVTVPWWALAAARLAESLDVALGHALCGSGLPDWAWRVPVGHPIRDEDNWLVNSLGSKLTDAFNYCFSLDWRFARPCPAHRLSVTRDQAIALEPVWESDCED
jgi:hypothetical protein